MPYNCAILHTCCAITKLQVNKEERVSNEVSTSSFSQVDCFKFSRVWETLPVYSRSEMAHLLQRCSDVCVLWGNLSAGWMWQCNCYSKGQQVTASTHVGTTLHVTWWFSDRALWIDSMLITNLMYWLLFIHKILFSSTCFEPQVLIFRRIQLYTCSIWYCHSLSEFVVACRYTAWVRTDCRGKVVGRAS